jgi:hypothetical protein
LNVAARTRAMMAEVERFLAGEISRAELQRWAEGLRRDGGGRPFAGNGAADALWTSLLSLEDRIGDEDEPLVRPIDLEELLRGLRAGEPFFDLGSFRPRSAPGASIYAARHLQRQPEEPAERLADLLDTLELDASDVTHPATEPAGGWRLLRADDNGNQELVATFGGYAKARAELACYEARQHKQTYWLEPTR